ncbi:MAG: hypothetical protein AMJ81_04830 [Phycisphaerae bacterium SM23_33]|nr:MAG: hypothetical protein AMJ81_04830 [Phycisphaerae bacterium SM23_33]
MKNAVWIWAVCSFAATGARAEPVSETWGGKGKYTHPGTLEVVSTGAVPRVVFDLSALPAKAKVHHASLFCPGGQPRQPIQILAVDKVGPDGKCSYAGQPLELEAPLYRSFNATEAVRRWAAAPARNAGLAAVSFPGSLTGCWLAIRYDGKAQDLPPQVEGLRAIHHDGQTFLVWKELPAFRPPAKEILWMTRMSGRATEVADAPGESVKGYPRAAAVRLKTLRDLQGLAVRDKPIGQWARAMPPFVRLREVPTVSYRVYRHSQRITAANLQEAELLGEVDALCAYQDGFINIDSHGEYYAPREHGDSILPTWSVAEGKPVLPGEAYYVHTPKAGGNFYYAVTAVQDGTENAARITDANSTAEAVAEAPAGPQPVLQFVTVNKTRYGNASATEHWYAYWLAPPFANLPDNRPRRVVMAIPDPYQPPGPMFVGTHAGMGPGWKVDNIQSAYLHIEQDISYGGDLCYHEGRATLRSFEQSRVDYFSDRYVTRMIEWALGRWKVDRSRITSHVGSHYGIRHPELFPILWFGPYEVDYDQKWNPAYGSLFGRLGPPELSRTVDGHRAWDVFNIAWYLAQDPGKDIPFWVHDVGGKESGHAVEYGWQDDARGLAALREARQPHVAHWGGGVISREIRDGLQNMSWTGSVPALSNCSLDASPGNGDPADGDPWGQINGFLFWDSQTVLDEKDRWAMTVYLTRDCFGDSCSVDLTPRHCRQLKPKPGQKFKWTNTSLETGEVVQSGDAAADKWGLVTLRQVIVTKGRNRFVIERQ